MTNSKDYIELLDNVLFKIDETLLIKEVSSNSSALLGLTDQEIIGKKISEIIQINQDLNLSSPWMEILDLVHPTPELKTVQFSLFPSSNEKEYFIWIKPMATAQDKDTIWFKRKNFRGIIHDLVAPLNSLQQIVYVMAPEHGVQDPQVYLEFIKSAVAQLTGVIQELETSAHFSDESDVIANVQSDLIKPVFQLFANQIYEKGIEFKFNGEVDFEFKLKKASFLRILINLMQNAIHYSQTQRIDLTVLFAPEKNTLRTIVKDYGKGLPQDVKDNLFTPFHRGDTSNQNPNGEGLGLYNVKRLVTGLKGEIKVNSEQNTGTEFVVDIPIRKTDAIDPLAKEMDWRVLKDKKIYVADDQQMNLKLLNDLLEMKGAKVSTFLSGFDLIEAMQYSIPDLIILDIVMPDIDGIQTAVRLQKQWKEKTPYIMALSGNVHHDNKLDYYCYGFDEVLGKPIEPEALFTKVAMGLNNEYNAGEFVENALRSLPIVDNYELEKLKNAGGESIIQELRGDFQEEFDHMISLLLRYDGNYNVEIYRSLHTCKSTAGTLGLKKMHSYIRYLEAKFLKLRLEPNEVDFLKSLLIESMNKLNK